MLDGEKNFMHAHVPRMKKTVLVHERVEKKIMPKPNHPSTLKFHIARGLKLI